VRKSKQAQPTLKDIARDVGVHVSTISRALNPNSGHAISPDLAAKIKRASSARGYKPHAAAAALRTNRFQTVGVIIPDITDPAFPPIIRGIEDGLARHRYVAIVANTDSDRRRQTRLIDVVRARGIDGFILASVLREDDEASRLAATMPVVTVSRTTDDSRVSSVAHDEDDGIRRVLTHLASLGHRDIATIAGPQTTSTGYNRHASYLRHYRELGLDTTTRPLIVPAREFNELEGERCAEELLVLGRPFTAVVCANDRLAVGAITAFRRHGLHCPQDVSITGFNDMPLADRLQPPLTTIRVQHYKAGVEAAELIVDAVENKTTTPRHIVLPVEMIVRSSTRSLIRPEGGAASLPFINTREELS
jgi:LacI family transcriptional regulator